MRVELLFTEDDPSYMAARQNLVEVLTEDAFETTIQMIAVGSMADAELLAFPGSPTIRIDGQDVDPETASGISLSLRRYSPDDEPAQGESSTGVPSKRLLRAAVERARGWSHGRR